MAESSARKEKLKQLIENLSDEQADIFAEQLTNRQAEEHPGTYKLFGDANPADVELRKNVGARPGRGYRRELMLSPTVWAEKVVEVARELGQDDPSKVYFNNKIYDIIITPAVPGNPRQGIPSQPETINTQESVF